MMMEVDDSSRHDDLFAQVTNHARQVSREEAMEERAQELARREMEEGVPAPRPVVPSAALSVSDRVLIDRSFLLQMRVKNQPIKDGIRQNYYNRAMSFPAESVQRSALMASGVASSSKAVAAA